MRLTIYTTKFYKNLCSIYFHRYSGRTCNKQRIQTYFLETKYTSQWLVRGVMVYFFANQFDQNLLLKAYLKRYEHPCQNWDSNLWTSMLRNIALPIWPSNDPLVDQLGTCESFYKCSLALYAGKTCSQPISVQTIHRIRENGTVLSDVYKEASHIWP